MSGPSNIDARVTALGLVLPPAPKPGGVYQPVVISGGHAYVSGHGPLRDDGSYIKGRLGADLDVAAGRAAARQTALAILASLKHALGSLDRVSRVVKLLGLVQATPDFGEHPAVINGCSELLSEIFGAERGVGARSAVGMASLPHGMAVEIEGIFEVV
jgi:enamine deaminase RidA (YjgF/YER057c/UK114 family)